jgi:hypothetical protein
MVYHSLLRAEQELWGARDHMQGRPLFSLTGRRVGSDFDFSSSTSSVVDQNRHVIPTHTIQSSLTAEVGLRRRQLQD